MPAAFELKLFVPLSAERRSELLDAAAKAEQIRSAKGHRAANEALLETVGLFLNPNLDDDYYREALEYHLGQIYAHLEMPDRAAIHFERSGTLPHAGSNLVFFEQVGESLILRERQMAAVKRGLPFILMSSMPRAASASLTQSISATLDLPIMRISTGDFPNYHIVPRWLNQFSAGGAVSHDHFSASEFNISTLCSTGIRHVFVLVRDPRASAMSLTNYRFKVRGEKPSNEDLHGAFMQTYLEGYIPWLTGWCEAAADEKSPLAIHWIRSDLARSDPTQAFRRIAEDLVSDYPIFRDYMDRQITSITANLVVGDDDAWRDQIDERHHTELWAAIPPRARELLELLP